MENSILEGTPPAWEEAVPASAEGTGTVLPATEKTGVAGVAVREALDSLRLQMAGGMSRASDYLYSQAPARASAAPPNRMADSLDRAANYLRATPVEEMAEDVAEVVRHYPAQFLAAALIVGIALGAALKRR